MSHTTQAAHIPHVIESFRVSDYKGVRGMVEVYPEGPGLIVIGGPNGSGKSSFIEAIEQIFIPGGIKATPKPINKDATEAVAEVTTSDARMVRTYKKDDAGKLDVFPKAGGGKLSKGVAYVQEHTGGAIFDTQYFVGLTEAEQRAELLARVELPFDLAAMEAERKRLYDERTEANRALRDVEAQLKAAPVPAEGAPAEEVSVAGIAAELQQVQSVNAQADQASQAAQAAARAQGDAAAEAQRLFDALEAAKVKYAQAEQAAQAAQAQAQAAQAQVRPVEPLMEALASADAVNAEVRAGKARAALAERVEVAKAAADGLSAQIAAVDERKQAGLAAAKLPGRGVTIDEGGLLVDGVPFKQINSAEQVIVSFDIATSKPVDVPLVFVKNGDMLDQGSVERMEAMAVERGFYVLMERDRDHAPGDRRLTFTEGRLV